MHSPLLKQHQQQLDCSRGMRGGPADVAVDLGAADASVTSPASSYYDAAHPIKGYVRTGDVAAGPVDIYYELHGLPHGMSLEQAAHRPKVVMLMGLACGCSAWRWQLQDLVQQHRMVPDFVGSSSSSSQEQQQQQPRLSDPDAQRHWQHEHAVLQPLIGGQQQEMLVCILDNRGVGHSSSPLKGEAYSTQHMAQDVLAVMDHLRWGSAHILGFSMGGFIAQALAVAAPQRVQSLTLLASSAGGLQIVPFSWSGLRVALKLVMARSPEDAVDATLAMHFRRRTLTAWVSHMRARRHDLLRREYLTPTGGPPQPPHGFKGQLAACWRHRLSKADANAIVSAGFPVLVIHGRNDKLASAANAERLARRLHCPCVILPGAHFVVRESAGQINLLLSQLVLGARHIHAIPNHTYLDPSPAVCQAWRQGAAQQPQGGKKGDNTAALALAATADDGGSSSTGRHASAALPADARDLSKVK